MYFGANLKQQNKVSIKFGNTLSSRLSVNRVGIQIQSRVLYVLIFNPKLEANFIQNSTNEVSLYKQIKEQRIKIYILV